MLFFIREEIKNYELFSGNLQKETTVQILETKPLLQTDLSVDELAAFSYFLFETKVLYCNNKQQFFRMMTSAIKTKKADRIAANSFGKKFYEISPKTIEKIKEKLIEMINSTRSYND